MQTLFLLAALGLFPTFNKQAATPWPSFQAPSRKTVTLMVFTASWCGPCARMKPALASLEADGVAVQRIDYDAERPLADRYGVTVLPTTIVLEGDAEIARSEGGLSLEEFRALVQRQDPNATKVEQEAKKTQSRPSTSRRRAWRSRRGRRGTANRR